MNTIVKTTADVVDIEADTVVDAALADEKNLIAGFDAVTNGLFTESAAERTYAQGQLAAAAEGIPALQLLMGR